MNEIQDAEKLQEIEDENLLKDIKTLLNDKVFQRVIIEQYINKTALDVGSNFSNTENEVDSLKAITHLKTFLTIE